jgi:hypothetical protein
MEPGLVLPTEIPWESLQGKDLEEALGLFHFILSTRLGNWPSILVVPKVVPPFVASFPDCQRTSPPFGGCSHRG